MDSQMDGLVFAVGTGGCETSQDSRTSEDDSFSTVYQAILCRLGASSVRPGTGEMSSLKVKVEVEANFQDAMENDPELGSEDLSAVFLAWFWIMADSNSTHVYRMLTGASDLSRWRKHSSQILGDHILGEIKG